MANGLLRSSFLSENVCWLMMKRHLFSSETLGIDAFKRIRIFELDKHRHDRKEFLENIKLKYGSVKSDHCKRIVKDAVTLLYIAENPSEISLAVNILRLFYTDKAYTGYSDQMNIEEGPLSPQRFQFGPLILRLLHIMKDMSTAQNLYSDPILKVLFHNTTCHLLLMDMLFEAGHFEQVVQCFTNLQASGLAAKFTPDCTTLAMAALYKLNTKESYQQMKRLLDKAEEGRKTLSRRTCLFAAALALQQDCPAHALKIVEMQTATNATFSNIQIMAKAALDKVKDVFAELEKRAQAQLPLPNRSNILYSDTVANLAKWAKQLGKEQQERYNSVMLSLEEQGLLSSQTVHHFVTRPIIRERRPAMSQSFKSRTRSPVKLKS